MPKLKINLKNISSYSQQILSRLKAQPGSRIFAAVIFTAIFASIGTYLLVTSRAATPYASLETEKAALSGPATKGSDANASGGEYVKFGSGQTDTEPPQGWQQAWDSASYTTFDAWYAANTGPSKNDPSLTSHQGTYNSTHNGQVIENLLIQNGTINIRHDNVTVRNVYIVQSTCSSCYGITYSPVWDYARTNAVVENVTIEGPRSENGATYAILLYGPKQTIRNVNIFGHKSGIGTFGKGETRIEYAWIHDAFYFQNLHSSMIAVRSSNTTVYRSNLNGGATAPFFIYAAEQNIRIEQTMFNVDGYSYCAGFGSNHPATHVKVIGNGWGDRYWPTCGGFGPYYLWSGSLPGNEWRDNVWWRTKQPFGG